MIRLDTFEILALPSLNVLLTEFIQEGMVPKEYRGRKIEVTDLHVDHTDREYIIQIKGKKPLHLPMTQGFVPAPSGSSYNAAVGFSKLEISTGIMGAIGNDMFASQLSESLSDEKIPLMAIPRGMGTPVTLSCLEHSDNPVTTLFVYKPDYRLRVNEALGLLNAKQYNFVLATGVRKSEVELTTRLFTLHQESNLLVPNGSLCKHSSETDIEILLKMTHIIQVNFEEAQMLTSGVTDDLEEMARIISAKGPKRVIITRDKDGVFIGRVNKSGGMKFYERSAFPANVVDTEGAGDSFCVGFIYGLLNKFPIQKCLAVGAWVASKNIEQIGGYGGMPTLDELKRVFKS